MVTIPGTVSSGVLTNIRDLIGSPLGVFVALVVGIGLILLFLEIITGHNVTMVDEDKDFTETEND